MPVYEYKCKRCSVKFEKLISRERRDDPGPCPECACARTTRVMSTFAGHSAGGGSIGGGGGCGGCTSSSCAGCHH